MDDTIHPNIMTTERSPTNGRHSFILCPITRNILRDLLPVRIVMRRTKISVGCSDLEPAVLKELLRIHESKFGDGEEVVVQSGSHPC